MAADEDMGRVELVHKRRVCQQTRARKKLRSKTEKDCTAMRMK